ncbi:MAG: sulfotransferase [Solirubrobacteraceae bacterium]|nr:sulfotransferase [Solirubrobacteraceae bacterium]
MASWRSRRRRPRPAGPGRAPDLIAVGAQACGVPWWIGLIAEHPRILAPDDGGEGAGFFDAFSQREMTDADVAAYHARFARPDGWLAADWGTRYLADAWTAPLIARAAPDAKLLVLLRDPVERYLAILRQRLREAVDPDEPILMTDMINWGRYATQLRALRAFVDPERILVLQYERCRADVLGEYRRTIRFLGLPDDGFVPRRLRRAARGKTGPRAYVRALRAAGLPEHVNRRWLRTSVRRLLRGRRLELPREPWPELDAALHAVLDPEVEALRELVPELDLSLWPHFAHLDGLKG